MKKLIAKIREILRNRRVRKLWTRTVSSIACLVVFVTTYALVLPAITMESQASCGIEAHQHDDSCYEERLTCTIPESDGHTHTEDCYSTKQKLICDRSEHLHTSACYDENGNLTCGLEEHQHGKECFEETRELVCGLEEAEGHHHDSSCYEKVLTCGKEAHTHSQACYREDAASEMATERAAVAATTARSEDANAAADATTVSEDGNAVTDATTASVDGNVAAAATTASIGGDTAADADGAGESTGALEIFDPAQTASEGYVPALEELDFQQLLNSGTTIYYHRPADDTEADSSEQITDWQKADKDTVLGKNDLLRVYLAYTIPAGSLNETNAVARYRLPANLHLTDDQIQAISQTENGLSGLYVDSDTLQITDTEKHASYLGCEAIDGTRTPDQKIDDYYSDSNSAGNGDQVAREIISAAVKAENVYDHDGIYREKNAYLGTDLVFTFSPYTILKNRNEYDSEGTPVKAGESVSGWFALDINMDQVDWDHNTAEIIFVSENKELNTGLVSATLQKADSTSEETAKKAGSESEGKTDSRNSDAEEVSDDSSSGEDAEDNTAEAVEKTHPAVSFEDSLTVHTGSLGSDTASGTLPESSKLTVSVSAEAGTFPAGTTMVLSAVTDMDAVAEAVEGTVDSKTRGFQAVDISFRDKDGNEIEPLKPISVTMRSDSIKAATEDSSMAPVVVHVEDRKKETAGAADTPAATVIDTLPDTTENKEQSEKPDVTNSPDAISFEADAFSVYAIVYTVDFHYEVNGKVYDFSIPGGGYVTLQQLVEVLGIANSGTYTENASKDAGSSGDSSGEDDGNVTNVAEVPGNDENSKTNTAISSNVESNAYGKDVTLKNVAVSEKTREFVADVAGVEFSTPGLLDVSKVEISTTVGAIKENRDLEVEYSKDLTAEQIKEINAQTVEAGDWALISTKPFTSEEIIAVTMENGEQFAVRVSDAQGDVYKISWDMYKAVPFFTPWLPPITVTSQVNLRYRDSLRNDLSDLVTGTIDEKIADGQTIQLTNSPYIKDIDGYTFSKIQYQGREITKIKASVVQVGSLLTYYYMDLYNGDTLLDRINMEAAQSINIDIVYNQDSINPEGGGTIPLPASLDPNELAPVEASKTLTPNLKDENDPESGDGTYKLTLSVKAPQKQGVDTTKANIVIVFDSSNSMNEPTQFEKISWRYYDYYTHQYGSLDEGRVYYELEKKGDTWYIKDPKGDKAYNGDHYIAQNGAEKRMDVAKTKVSTLAEKLLENNAEDKYGPGTVELAFVEFGTEILHPAENTRKTEDLTTFNTWVNQCSAPELGGDNEAWKGATNWELALQTANSIDFKDNDQTYIIFISDGNPTVRHGEPHDESDGTRINGRYQRGWRWVTEHPDGIYGTGNSDTEGYNFRNAETQAVAIAQEGKVLYNIGIFGDATRMSTLTNHGYFDAANSAEIEAAIESIIKSISARIGYHKVNITDGITSMTSSALVPGEVSGFSYSIIDKDGNPVEVDDSIKTAAYTEKSKTSQSGVSYLEKGVTWNLGDEMLLDEATYSVSFTVWPDQDAYDLVADLNNGKRKFSELNEIERTQVVANQGVYSLRTNTDAYVKYTPYKVMTDSKGNIYKEDGKEKQINLIPPEPMGLIDEKITVKKVWDDSLDPTQLENIIKKNSGYKAELILKRVIDDEEEDYITDIKIGAPTPITNPVSREWPDLDTDGSTKYRYISAGLMVSENYARLSNLLDSIEGRYPKKVYGGVTYYILEEGHDYYFQEAPGSDFHFELENRKWHPMVVDGEAKILTYNPDNTFQEISDVNTLTATNKLRSGLNIVKKVYDEDNQEITTDDNTFYIKLTVKDKNGKEIHYSDYLRTKLGKSDYPVGEITNKKHIDERYWLITANSGEKTYTYYSMNEDGSGQIDQDEYPVWYNEYNEYTETDDGTNIRIDGVDPWIVDGIWESGEVKKIKPGQLLRLKNIPYGTQVIVSEVVPEKNEQGIITGYTEVNVNQQADGYTLIGIDGNNVTADFNHSYNVIVKNRPEPLFFRKADIAYKDITDESRFKTLNDAEFELYQGHAKLYISSSGKVLTQQEVELIIEKSVNEDGAAAALESAGIKDRIKFCVDGESCKLIIPKGQYKFKEIASPEGYIITEEALEFSVGSDSGNKIKVTEESEYMDFRYIENDKKPMVTIYNEPGAALPNTGGPGTKMLYLFGIMLTGLAGIVLIKQNWRNREKFN